MLHLSLNQWHVQIRKVAPNKGPLHEEIENLNLKLKR